MFGAIIGVKGQAKIISRLNGRLILAVFNLKDVNIIAGWMAKAEFFFYFNFQFPSAFR